MCAASLYIRFLFRFVFGPHEFDCPSYETGAERDTDLIDKDRAMLGSGRCEARCLDAHNWLEVTTRTACKYHETIMKQISHFFVGLHTADAPAVQRMSWILQWAVAPGLWDSTGLWLAYVENLWKDSPNSGR